jgi:mgtE-like transporter
MRRRPRPLARIGGLLGPDAAAARQALLALFLNSSTSFIAGAFLGAITDTLAKYPGLLVLVPAAIGLRGNIFGALGNRLSTAIHTGTFRLSARPDTVLGQNVLAAAILTMGMSLILAVVAKAIAVGLGLQNTVSVADLATISIVGGILGSLVVLAGTIALSAGAVRYGWDLDNVTAPIVSVLGDVLTLPALWLATFLIGVNVFSPVLAIVLIVVSFLVTVAGFRTKLDRLRRIVRESFPILIVAGAISAMAGVTLEKSFAKFAALPALLVLEPAHLSSSGALGGILSGRLSSKLFLGVVEPTSVPGRLARRDIAFLFLLCIPTYAFNGIGAHYVAGLIGEASPGLGQMVALSLIAGITATTFVVLIAYYGTIVTFRTGLDPDTYGIPMVSSSMDFLGAFTLIVTIALLGIS